MDMELERARGLQTRRRTDAKLFQAGGELVTRQLLALIVIHRVEHLHHRPGPCLKLLLDLPHYFIDLRRAREGRHVKRIVRLDTRELQRLGVDGR